jgi:guanylate kinase
MVTAGEVARLKNAGEIVWENRRYNAAYYVDGPALAQDLSEAWPILHLGQTQAISAVKAKFDTSNWLTVYLWCPREVAQQRVVARRTGDVDARMIAWDATVPIDDALFIDTASTSPEAAAKLIDSAFRHTHV